MEWQPTSVFLPERAHGQRSLVGYSRWGHKELHSTEHAHSFCQPFQGFFHNKVRDKLSIRLRAHEMQDQVTLSIVSSTLA